MADVYAVVSSMNRAGITNTFRIPIRSTSCVPIWNSRSIMKGKRAVSFISNQVAPVAFQSIAAKSFAELLGASAGFELQL